jgi:hypothetical protein
MAELTEGMVQVTESNIGAELPSIAHALAGIPAYQLHES